MSSEQDGLSKIPIIRFLFKSEWKVLGDAVKLNPEYQTQESEGGSELAMALNTMPGCLVITSLRDRNDFVQLATFIKFSKKVAKDVPLKVVAVNFTGDRQYEKAASKLGILDVIEGHISTKALKFKIDFWMKSLVGQVKKNALKADANEVKSLEAAKEKEKKLDEKTANWIEPIDCESDIWLIQSKNDCKKVLSRWLVKLMGPSPYIGQWIETNQANAWKFDVQESRDLFISGNGSWFFRGDQKPDFIWKENLWLMTGDNCELFFKDGETVYSRFKLKDKSLSISENSEYAKTKEQIILESFNKELVFKKEGSFAKTSEEIEADNEKLQNLEGKGKTDQINGNPLSGKAGTDQLDGGPLSGKGKTDQVDKDPLSGKGGTSDLSSDPLSQKTQTEKGKNYWANKNEYKDESGKGDLNGPGPEGVNSGKQLGLAPEKQAGKEKAHSLKKDEVAKDLHGKGKTDEIDADPLSGHVGSKAPEAARKKEESKNTEEVVSKEKANSLRKDEVAKDLHGKGKRDEIDADPLSGYVGSKAIEAARKKEEAKNTEELLGIEKPAPEISPEAKKSYEAKLLEDEEKNAARKAARAADSKISTHMRSLPKKPGQPKEGGEDKQGDLNDQQARAEGVDNTGYAQFDERPVGDEYDVEEQARPTNKRTNREADVDSEVDNNILPFSKAKVETPDEVNPDEELEKASQTARVISTLSQGARKVHCDLDDFFDQTIIFKTTESGIYAEKLASLDLVFDYLGQKTPLKFDGKVTSVEPDGEGQHYITIELTGRNSAAFDKFMKLYQSRQDNANLFIKTAKGH